MFDGWTANFGRDWEVRQDEWRPASKCTIFDSRLRVRTAFRVCLGGGVRGGKSFSFQSLFFFYYPTCTQAQNFSNNQLSILITDENSWGSLYIAGCTALEDLLRPWPGASVTGAVQLVQLRLTARVDVITCLATADTWVRERAYPPFGCVRSVLMFSLSLTLSYASIAQRTRSHFRSAATAGHVRGLFLLSCPAINITSDRLTTVSFFLLSPWTFVVVYKQRKNGVRRKCTLPYPVLSRPSRSNRSHRLVFQTIYTYLDNFRAYKALIAAQYSGADVKVDSAFEFGVTNKQDSFLKKFPQGKVITIVIRGRHRCRSSCGRTGRSNIV